jgi:hypothetical protein
MRCRNDELNTRVKQIPLLLVAAVALALISCQSTRPLASTMQRIVMSPDGRGFVFAESRKPFRPWGLNYGNKGRLMEDFWDGEWETFAGDFREMKALGANVVRVHLQFGKFMDGPDTPNPAALAQLERILKLAEQTGLYLDVTGLACYRKADVPAWYDALDEAARWSAQANFWRAVAARCAASPAVFCYDLINEPLAPGQRREPRDWYSGKPFGGYDFLQYIALAPSGRKREEVAVAWIEQMTRAIRAGDPSRLITVGLLPWVQGWGHLSGFLPARVAPKLDFISVHIYPVTDKPEEARRALQECAVGKPVVIEETFPLTCSTVQLEKFLRESTNTACGWIGHYDGTPLEELNTRERERRITLPEVIMRDWLLLFERLKPELLSDRFEGNH